MSHALNAVRNPNPIFRPKSAPALPFIGRLMKNAAGAYSSHGFDLVVALARRDDTIKRRPTENSVRVLECLTQAALFHYDLIADRVFTSAHNIAVRCGLGTEKNNKMSIGRVLRHLALMERLGLISRSPTLYRDDLGCYETVAFTFTDRFWLMIADVEPERVESERRARYAYENQQREKKKLPRLSLADLAMQKIKSWRDYFTTLHARRKRAGELRHQRAQDQQRTRAEVRRLVYAAIMDKIRRGILSFDTHHAMKSEIERLTNQRMTTRKLSTRLAVT